MKESTLKYNLQVAVGKLPRGEQLRAIRAVCKQLDITMATYKRYERLSLEDPFDIKINHLYKIAAMFNVKADDLLTPVYKKELAATPDIAHLMNEPALSPYREPKARKHQFIFSKP